MICFVRFRAACAQSIFVTKKNRTGVWTLISVRDCTPYGQLQTNTCFNQACRPELNIILVSGLKQTEGVNLDHHARMADAWEKIFACLVDLVFIQLLLLIFNLINFTCHLLPRNEEFATAVSGSAPMSLVDGAIAPPLDLKALEARMAKITAGEAANKDMIYGVNLAWVNLTLPGCSCMKKII